MVEKLLKEYDLFHSSIVNGGKVKLNINYILGNKVYISLVSLVNGKEKKTSYDFDADEEFEKFALPKIVQRFLSKNLGIKIRRIMGNDTSGTLLVERADSKDSLIIRNCSSLVMDLVTALNDSLIDLSNVDMTSGFTIIFNSNSNQQYDKYMKYNIIYDYATYKNEFFENSKDESSEIKDKSTEEENKDKEQLLILNIARYAYTFENSSDIWDQIVESYKENSKVIDICNEFKKLDFDASNNYTKALVLADFEKNNDLLLHHNNDEIELALEACENSTDIFNNSYLAYFRDKERYYANILDGKHQAICEEFLNAYDLNDNKYDDIEIKNRMNKKDKDFINRIKKISQDRHSFTSIDDSKDENNGPIIIDIDKEEILKEAEDQARRLIEIEKERDQLKKDAEEFAKMILQREKEQKEIMKSAEEQARKLIEMKKENDELKRLAEVNARFLFDREKRFKEEEEARQYMENTPVKSQDIDKINALLNSISEAKELDFAVNHPTIMQELILLEHKIVTYLTTHTNIIHEEDKIVPIEKEEMLETKPVIELLAMIRNTYSSSHAFEKDGRHTLINFNPVDEDTFRVSLYSIKDESEDVLMDAFFEENQLTDNVLQELCDIFKLDAVIVASKTDNVPPNKADYLVIDNMNNAIKFVDCPKDLIERIKNYL